MNGAKAGKRLGRKHGSQSVFKDRRGRNRVRYLLLPDPFRGRVHPCSQSAAAHHSSNRRHDRHYLARLQMEEASR